jgi:hypothetical protein
MPPVSTAVAQKRSQLIQNQESLSVNVKLNSGQAKTQI